MRGCRLASTRGSNCRGEFGILAQRAKHWIAQDVRGLPFLGTLQRLLPGNPQVAKRSRLVTAGAGNPGIAVPSQRAIRMPALEQPNAASASARDPAAKKLEPRRKRTALLF